MAQEDKVRNMTQQEWADLLKEKNDFVTGRVARFANSTVVSMAEKLFNAYNSQGPNPWKTWDGKDVPRWEALSEQVVAKWTAVARYALEYA